VNATSTEGPTNIGPNSIVHVEGVFEMGDSYINSHARILCGERITIGDGCAIAWNVELLDTDRHKLYVDGEQVKMTKPIKIQDDVWIGHNVTVKKGVTIGEGAVVASDSVVTQDVAPRTLVAGTPAKVIKENVRWEQ